MNWNKRTRRYIQKSALSVLLVLSVAIVPIRNFDTVSASTVESLQQQKSATESKLNAANNETSELEAEEAEIEAEIEATNEEIVQIIASISLLEDEIEELEVQIAEKQEEYDQAKADEEERYAAMKQRIKYMYEKGESTYVQVLLNAASFSDMLNKVDYVNQLYEYDRRMLEEYQEVQAKVAEVKAELEDKQAEDEEARLGLVEEQAALEEVVAELEEKSEDISLLLEEAYAAAAELAAELTAQTAALADAVEAEAAAAEAQRQAEAAAAEAAAAAASASDNEEDEDEDEDTSSSDADSSETSSSDSSSSDSDSSSSSSSSSSSTSSSTLVADSNGVTGQTVANYACQFVGNPYVYGGNSLTEGTDCSGFTYLIYQHFGYTIGRTDTSQRSAGIAVDSLENALPGDIICYPGHVGLYIGNGTIVHASTEATGIKYSSATYRTYVCIRRIIY